MIIRAIIITTLSLPITSSNNTIDICNKKEICIREVKHSVYSDYIFLKYQMNKEDGFPPIFVVPRHWDT